MLHPVISALEQDPARLRAHWCLPQAEARFLYLLARIGQARHIVEVGTSIGYSTLHLALAASRQGGHVTSIDASAERQAEAARHLEDAGLSPWATLTQGDALTLLQRWKTETRPCDLLFLDARKSEYSAYLAFGESLLSSGGVLLADNTRSHRAQMADFIRTLADSPSWESADLETPLGLILARKK